MTRKKKLLTVKKRGCQNKKNSKNKGKMSNIGSNIINLQNQYNDLQLKFKLKELRIVLHDIVVNKTILPCRKPLVNKNTGSLKVIDKNENNTSKRIYLSDRKPSDSSITNTECSNVISSATAIGIHDTDEKITKKQNVDNNVHIKTKPLNADEQKTCSHKHARDLTNSNSKSSKKIKKFQVSSDVGYTINPENTNLPIAATNSKKNIDKKVYPKSKKLSDSCITNIECSNVISSITAIEKHDTDEKITEKQNVDNNFDIKTKLLNADEQKTYSHKYTKDLTNSNSKSSKKIKKFQASSDVGYTINPENTNLPIAATNSKKNTDKKIYSKSKKLSDSCITNIECPNVISSATAIGKHDTDEKITKKQNVDNNFDIKTKPLNADEQKTCSHKHTKDLTNSNSKSSKKKEKFQASSDVGYTINPENTNLPIAATNSKKNTDKKIYLKSKELSDSSIINTECSNVISSTTAIEKHDTDEKITEKQNVDNNFDIKTKPLNADEQKTCSHKHTKDLTNSNSKSSKKIKECEPTSDIGYTIKPGNTDLPIAATNNNQNHFFDTSNEAGALPNMDTENKERKEDINFNEPNEDMCSIVQTDEESPKDMEEILINQEDMNMVYDENSLKERDLPKIREDKILAKNTVLLKVQDSMQTTNNVQDTAYYTTMVLQNERNEHLSIEKHTRVVDLTEDNLHKFTENYNESLVPEANDVSLCTTEKLSNSVNSNCSEIILKTKKDDLHTLYRKRGWITPKTAKEPDKAGIKRIKLNRKCIQENSCTSKNSSVCPSDNKSPNLFSNCHNTYVNNDKVQNMDDCLTLYSNNGNSLCTIQLVSESSKADCDDVLKSTHVVEKNICSSSHTIFNEESEKNELLLTEKYHQNAENIDENNLNENEILSCSTQLYPQNQVESKINDNHDTNHNNDGGDDDNQNNDGGDGHNQNNDGDDDNNPNNDGGDDDNQSNGDDDDDCISLFTDIDSLSSVVGMAIPSEKKPKNTVDNYRMTGTIFNNYLQQNILECNRQFDSVEKNDTLQDKNYQTNKEIEQNNIPMLESLSTNVASIRSINSPVINNNNSSCLNEYCNKSEENVCDDETVTTCTKELETTICHALCKGYCFSKMRHGDCNRSLCYFNHDLQPLIRNIILKYEQYLISIISYIHYMKYYYFLKRLYIQSLQEFEKACILDLYKKIYSIQYANLEMVCITVEALLHKGMHSKDVVDSLCKILSSTDSWTPQWILNSIKDKIKVGEYWDTLRNLITYVKPTKQVIESILNDCIITRKNIQDVQINLINRLHPIEINLLNKDLMLSFNKLLKHEYQNEPDEISPTSVSLPNNEGSSKESYVLRSISDLPEAHSQYRNKFWKLYLMIHNVKEALVHEDYDYIISILDKHKEISEEETLFSRCCFHMLTAEIKHSEYHITKIIEHAVQIGASSILYKVLLDVATYILVKLIIENAWTLAYKLLKILQVYNLQHNAAFIILSAEIYLANKNAIEALMLIKQSNLISTNRNNWNVASNAQDYYPRTYVIGILLDVLCIISPEHAFFIFEFLTKDQGNNSRPVDLTHYVDKLMLKLLIEKEIDLIIKMGYMIIEYNFSFFNITICRAAIASIVHIDMVLAKQLYQYASGLGIYRTIEILPVIHAIINVDWVEEEIYLTFWDLFKRLVMEIGHSIDHLNPAQVSVYVIFEIVPTEAHLYCENPDDQQMKKIQISKNLVRQVLRTRFEPSILSSQKTVNGAIMKLQSKSVINHLKEIYKNYSE